MENNPHDRNNEPFDPAATMDPSAAAADNLEDEDEDHAASSTELSQEALLSLIIR